MSILQKVNFTIDESGVYHYEKTISGFVNVITYAADYVLFESNELIGQQVGDKEFAILLAEYSTKDTADEKRSTLYKIGSLLRFRAESRGTTLPDGTVVNTDRESVSIITTGYVGLSSGLRESFRWKVAETTWVDLTLPEVTAIAQAAYAWVEDTVWVAEENLQIFIGALSDEDIDENTPYEVNRWFSNLLEGRAADVDPEPEEEDEETV